MKYVKIYLPVCLVIYIFAFFSGVHKFYPYDLIIRSEAIVNKIAIRYLFAPPKELIVSSSQSKDEIWNQIIIPTKLEHINNYQLNNFELRWSKVNSNELTITGAVRFINDRILYINQNNALILKRLNLTEKNIKNGGIKAVFEIKGKEYAYVSYVDGKCATAAIYDLTTYLSIYTLPCLPDLELVDLNGTGGAFLKISDDTLLLTTGTPTALSTIIPDLAQEQNSPWGKILKLKFNGEVLSISIISKGHRNPQGILMYKNDIFSTDHGPRGGDEINLIKINGNYGWPIQSMGSQYNLNIINKDYEKVYNGIRPLLAFVPSIGISYINKCPAIYEAYYSPSNCLAASSLRGAAIFLVVFSSDGHVLFVEKIPMGSRIRKFEFREDVLYAVTDWEGAIIGKFLPL